MTTKRGRKPKYLHTIILDGVNAREVYKKYKQGRKEDSQTPPQAHFTPIIEYSSKDGENTTQITELTNKKRPSSIFYTAPKDDRTVTMLDYVNYGCLPERTDVWCFHHKHPFNTSPLGMPIQWLPRRPDKLQERDEQISGTNDYFLTYGIFCSWSCMMAFYEEHKHDPLFRLSKPLIYNMHYKMFKTELTAKPASSWEKLKVFGGDFSVEEFVRSFCNCNYIITPNIKRPYMVSVGRYIEERRCGYI